MHEAYRGSPFAETGIAAGPCITVLTGGALSPVLADAARLCAVECRVVAPDALTAGAALTGQLVWAIGDDPDAGWMCELLKRRASATFPLVIETTLTGLDAWFAAAAADATLVVEPDRAAAVTALAAGLHIASGAVHAPADQVRDREIEALQEEVQRISRMLGRLAMEPPGPAEPPSPFIDDHVGAPTRGYNAGPASAYAGAVVTARDVRQVIRQRRLRDELFDSELFADPAWDMLLDLYAAKLDRSRVSVSSLCIAAAVPATTALRWIKTLTQTGMFERKADNHDARRIFVELSDSATQAMHRYFTRLADPRLAI